MSRIARTLPNGEPDDSSRRASLGYPKRLTLDPSQDDHDALMGARYADRVPMADRIRALVSLWREDPQLAAAVSLRAQELMPPPPGLTALPPRDPASQAPPGS